MKNTKVKYSFAQWCVDNKHEDYLNRWDYELNDIGPDAVAYRSKKKFFFKCPRCLHESSEFQLCVVSREENYLNCKKCNSIGQFLIDTYGEDAIDKMWSDKNILDPFFVPKGTTKNKVWLKCKTGEHPDSEFNSYSIYCGSTCKVCSKYRVITGCNDVTTTHPEYVKYFYNKQEATKVSRWTETKIDMICPDCGAVFKKRVCDLISYGFNCKHCGDKSTYPNKYMYEFLCQLQKKYSFDIFPEHVFEWSKNLNQYNISKRVYDFYVSYNGFKIIIEVHGEQHFNGSFSKYNCGRTLDEEIENDTYKKELAISNGIDASNYVIIDARKSDSDWIKHSILNSKMSYIFQFKEDDIDWSKCDSIACKNLVKIASDLWNDGTRSTALIAKKIGKSKCTVIKYLKRAYKLGWCDYNPKH